VIVVFDPTSKSQANEVKSWCETFAQGAALQTGQLVVFAHMSNSTKHKSLTITIGGGQSLTVPIVNAWCEAPGAVAAAAAAAAAAVAAAKTSSDARSSGGGGDEDAGGDMGGRAGATQQPQDTEPSSADVEFASFLSTVYPFYLKRVQAAKKVA
jgi:hypothetical protein